MCVFPAINNSKRFEIALRLMPNPLTLHLLLLLKDPKQTQLPLVHNLFKANCGAKQIQTLALTVVLVGKR